MKRFALRTALVSMLGAAVLLTACSTATPTPTAKPTPTATPSPTITYAGARFQSGSVSGKGVSVPLGSSVDAYVTLDATANMRGELRVEVWKAIAPSLDQLVLACSEAATLEKGTQEVFGCQFTAEELTNRTFTHYYLKTYWSGAPLVTEPRPEEGVTTVSGPTSTPTPTPSVTKEWKLEDVLVDGSTVRVLLRVYAGIDVDVTLDDRDADEVNVSLPLLEYVFRDVTPGEHIVEVLDVVGFNEEVRIKVATLDPVAEIPDWLAKLIDRLEHEPVANPPASVLRYEYKGQTVYFLPQRCCDIFSDLYDSDGNIIAHPDGGITGRGDGRAPDFFEERTNEKLIWSDKRKYDADLREAPAPIESVEVWILESYPPQYVLAVVSGLPNGCASFAGYRLTRDAQVIRVEIINWEPIDSSKACTEEYRILEHRIHLGSDFEPGKTYTVDVNGTVKTFVAQ